MFINFLDGIVFVFVVSVAVIFWLTECDSRRKWSEGRDRKKKKIYMHSYTPRNAQINKQMPTLRNGHSSQIAPFVYVVGIVYFRNSKLFSVSVCSLLLSLLLLACMHDLYTHSFYASAQCKPTILRDRNLNNRFYLNFNPNCWKNVYIRKMNRMKKKKKHIEKKSLESLSFVMFSLCLFTVTVCIVLCQLGDANPQFQLGTNHNNV